MIEHEHYIKLKRLHNRNLNEINRVRFELAKLMERVYVLERLKGDSNDKTKQ